MSAATGDALESSDGDALPDGWEMVEHEGIGMNCYIHMPTRVCSWTRPYVCDVASLEAIEQRSGDSEVIEAFTLEEAEALANEPGTNLRGGKRRGVEPREQGGSRPRAGTVATDFSTLL